MRRWVKRGLRWWLRTPRRALTGLCLGAYGGVVALNALVWVAGGGAPRLWSPFNLDEKMRALGAYVAHFPRHVLEDTCSEGSLAPVRAAARLHRVPVALAVAVAKTESALDSHAISHAGAMGLMQLMPDTADHMKVEDPFDPAQSANGGVRYLGWLMKRYQGDVDRTIAAYNAGPYAVPKQGPLRLSGETRIYLKKVRARMPTPVPKRPKRTQAKLPKRSASTPPAPSTPVPKDRRPSPAR